MFWAFLVISHACLYFYMVPSIAIRECLLLPSLLVEPLVPRLLLSTAGLALPRVCIMAVCRWNSFSEYSFDFATQTSSSFEA